MKRIQIRAWASLFACLLSSVAVNQLPADEPPAAATGNKFIRMDKDATGNLKSLQTAIVHYVPQDPQASGATVDLIGAVHVGEKSYYEDLNKLFEKYDVVLYELVAPEGTRVPLGAKPGNHPVAMLQNGLKDMLGLEHQLQYIDYSKANLTHADMSPDQFSKSMDDRGESLTGLFFRMMGQGLAQQSKMQAAGKNSDLALFTALLDGDRSSAMKRLMAEQFDSMESMLQALEGPQGSTLITERNKVALAKVSQQIEGGKKKIAIFYGAGHLGDMENRLQTDYHMRRDGEQWLTAWKLDKPAPPNGK